MARPAHHDSAPYQPTPRQGHQAVQVDGKLYSWGGKGVSATLIPAKEVELFTDGRWVKMTTQGTPPPAGFVWSGCTAIGRKIFHFGGEISFGRYSNALHELDTTTLMWREVIPKNPSNRPIRRKGCSLIPHGRDRLVMVGGSHGGLNFLNDVHVFDLKEGTWSSPRVTGTPPEPRAFFSFTKIDEDRVILFGGRLKSGGWANDVFILDMQHWHWTKLSISGASLPAGRNFHTTCCLSGPLVGTSSMKLLVVGGIGKNDAVLADAWVLDLDSRTWTEVELPGAVGPRWQHTTTVLVSGPRSVHLLTFGGKSHFRGGVVAATAVLQMELFGDKVGEPLKWRVVGVATHEDHVTWKEWKKKADGLKEELQKQGKMRTLMKQKRPIRARAATVVLFGIPRSGKSSLLRRMLKDPSVVMFSTPVAERPRRIFIKSISPTRAAILGSQWVPQNPEDEKLHLIQHALNEETGDDPDSEMGPQSNMVIVTSSTTAQIAHKQVSKSTSTSPNSDGSAQQSPSAPSGPVSTESPPSFESPEQILMEVLRSGKLDEVEELLEDTTILHILDTGGQPEFLEILPALLTGPTINIIVFKLNEDLDERFVVEYVAPDGSTTKPYVSSFTVNEVLFQALASASCAAPPISQSVSTSPLVQSLSSAQSATIFVGTHKDMVSDKEVQATDDALQTKLTKVVLPQGNIIHNCTSSQTTNIVVPVDNTNPSDPGVNQVRELVNDVLQKQFDSPETPLAWMMFHLSACSTNARALTLEQCAAIAKECNIETNEELSLALWFLSHRCGIFRYFPDVKELSDIVICDLSIIFDAITKLVSCGFHFEGPTVTSTEVQIQLQIRQSGRFPATRAEKLLEEYSEIPVRKFLKLLEHLRILSPITTATGEVREYFLPCILPQYPVETLERIPDHSAQPAPLLFTFKCGYCPLRLFIALTVHLSSPALESALTWQLYNGNHKEYKPYRNKITFLIGEDFDKITLIARPTFYEVRINRAVGIANPQPLHTVCDKVRSTLEVAITSAKLSLNSTLEVPHQTAFYCRGSGCHSPPHPAVISSKTTKMGVCCFSKIPSPLSVNQRIWLGKEMPHDQDVSVVTPPQPATKSKLQISLNNIDDIQLDDKSLFEVKREVVDVTRWFDLGLALGLKFSTLEAIKIRCREDVHECKTYMLTSWLQMNDNVPEKGFPSWRSLVAGLRDPLVNYPDIAETIAKKYPKGQSV